MKSSESFFHIEEIKQMGEGAGEDCFVEYLVLFSVTVTVDGVVALL